MWHLWSPPYGALPLITGTATEFHSLNMACDESRWRICVVVVVEVVVECVKGCGVWGMCRGIIIIPPPPPHPHPHPPNHHWCDKNFTSPRNFIYSVDIRLWLKTIKKRERERDGATMPWIAYANQTLGIYLVEVKGTDWRTAWHTGTALTMTTRFAATPFFHAISGLFPFSAFFLCPLFPSFPSSSSFLFTFLPLVCEGFAVAHRATVSKERGRRKKGTNRRNADYIPLFIKMKGQIQGKGGGGDGEGIGERASIFYRDLHEFSKW